MKDYCHPVIAASKGPASKDPETGTPEQTIPALLRRCAETHAQKPALRVEREKQTGLAPGALAFANRTLTRDNAPPSMPYGERDGQGEDQWKTWTYKQYYEDSCNIAKVRMLTRPPTPTHTCARAYRIRVCGPWCKADHDCARCLSVVLVVAAVTIAGVCGGGGGGGGVREQAMMRAGVQQFDAVAIFGFNSPEWVMASQACFMTGAKTAGIYPTDTPEQIAYKWCATPRPGTHGTAPLPMAILCSCYLRSAA